MRANFKPYFDLFYLSIIEHPDVRSLCLYFLTGREKE